MEKSEGILLLSIPGKNGEWRDRKRERKRLQEFARDKQKWSLCEGECGRGITGESRERVFECFVEMVGFKTVSNL
jgi:hypothetical protein